MKRNELANAFSPIPEDCYRTLMTAAHNVKEETIVKKKLSAAVVLAVVVVLILGAAFAVISMQSAGRQVLETEQENGDYAQWPLNHKVSLVQALVDLGYTDETADVKSLLAGNITGDEADRKADAILTEFTGLEVSEICFMTIMQAAWGPFETWSPEEQAWYSSLMVEMGIQRDGVTLYVMPAGGIDEQTAVQMAREAVAKGYGVDESTLDAYAMETSFQVPEFAVETGDTQAYWYVGFFRPPDMPEEDALFEGFEVFIHPETGEFIESVDEMIAERKAQEARRAARENDPLMIEISEFELAHRRAYTPYSWTIEEFAEWSAAFHERGYAKLQEHPEYFTDMTAAMLTYAYGFPDDKAISQEEALSIAEDAIVTRIGRKAEEVQFFTHGHTALYDITDPEHPLWKFFFQMPSIYDSDTAFAQSVEAYYGADGERLPNIKVEIDAYTGEVVDAFTIDFADFGYQDGENNKGAEGYLKVF
jgi:hypothetical protein